MSRKTLDEVRMQMEYERGHNSAAPSLRPRPSQRPRDMIGPPPWNRRHWEGKSCAEHGCHPAGISRVPKPKKEESA